MQPLNLTELVLGKVPKQSKQKSESKPNGSRASSYGIWTIDTNIPIPKPRSGHKAYYPWKELEIGESFFVPGKRKATGAYRIKDCETRKFISERRVEDGVEGVRVWRIA